MLPIHTRQQLRSLEEKNLAYDENALEELRQCSCSPTTDLTTQRDHLYIHFASLVFENFNLGTTLASKEYYEDVENSYKFMADVLRK